MSLPPSVVANKSLGVWPVGDSAALLSLAANGNSCLKALSGGYRGALQLSRRPQSTGDERLRQIAAQ